jgi:hypothetical protein
MAKGVWNRLSIVDLGDLILTTREMRSQFWTPPPPLCLKIEWQGAPESNLDHRSGSTDSGRLDLLAAYPTM